MHASLSRTTRRNVGPAASPVATTNDFHVVRTQEFQRERAVRQQGASEDQVKSPYFVPSLQSMCATVLARNYMTMPEIDTQLRDQGESALYAMVIEQVPTDEASLPLRDRVARVTDEGYWKRACETTWSLGQLSKMTQGDARVAQKTFGWKRLYLEQTLNDGLMSFGQRTSAAEDPNKKALQTAAGMASLRGSNPGPSSAQHLKTDNELTEEDARRLADLCTLCRDYVHTVDLPCQYVHLNLYEHLFSRVPGILHFRLTYNTSAAGVGYHSTMVGFSDDDAMNVRLLLTKYPSLETLRLPSNKLQPDQALSICAGLVRNTTLRVLDLSRNAINGVAAEALATILCRPDFPLEELSLGDNDIGADGATALASALDMNKTLRLLDVSQNAISDEAGAVLVQALDKHPSLTEVRLGQNRLAAQTAAALCVALPRLHLLTHLDLSGNRQLGGSTPYDTLLPAGTRGSAASGVPPHLTRTEVGGRDGDEDDSLPPLSSAPAEAADPPPASERGPALCAAVEANPALLSIGVRHCNFGPQEVARMEKTTQRRVQSRRAQALAASGPAPMKFAS